MAEDTFSELKEKVRNKFEILQAFLQNLHEKWKKSISYRNVNLIIYFLEAVALQDKEINLKNNPDFKVFISGIIEEADREIASHIRSELLHRKTCTVIKVEDFSKIISGNNSKASFISTFFRNIEGYVVFILEKLKNKNQSDASKPKRPRDIFKSKEEIMNIGERINKYEYDKIVEKFVETAMMEGYSHKRIKCVGARQCIFELIVNIAPYILQNTKFSDALKVLRNIQVHEFYKYDKEEEKLYNNGNEFKELLIAFRYKRYLRNDKNKKMLCKHYFSYKVLKSLEDLNVDLDESNNTTTPSSDDKFKNAWKDFEDNITKQLIENKLVNDCDDLFTTLLNNLEQTVHNRKVCGNTINNNYDTENIQVENKTNFDDAFEDIERIILGNSDLNTNWQTIKYGISQKCKETLKTNRVIDINVKYYKIMQKLSYFEFMEGNDGNVNKISKIRQLLKVAESNKWFNGTLDDKVKKLDSFKSNEATDSEKDNFTKTFNKIDKDRTKYYDNLYNILRVLEKSLDLLVLLKDNQCNDISDDTEATVSEYLKWLMIIDSEEAIGFRGKQSESAKGVYGRYEKLDAIDRITICKELETLNIILLHKNEKDENKRNAYEEMYNTEQKTNKKVLQYDYGIKVEHIEIMQNLNMIDTKLHFTSASDDSVNDFKQIKGQIIEKLKKKIRNENETKEPSTFSYELNGIKCKFNIDTLTDNIFGMLNQKHEKLFNNIKDAFKDEICFNYLQSKELVYPNILRDPPEYMIPFIAKMVLKPNMFLLNDEQIKRMIPLMSRITKLMYNQPNLYEVFGKLLLFYNIPTNDSKLDSLMENTTWASNLLERNLNIGLNALQRLNENSYKLINEGKPGHALKLLRNELMEPAVEKIKSEAEKNVEYKMVAETKYSEFQKRKSRTSQLPAK